MFDLKFTARGIEYSTETSSIKKYKLILAHKPFEWYKTIFQTFLNNSKKCIYHNSVTYYTKMS